ncbi:gamma-glutamyl-gamma-aminobutyrate hydrolase family protein [Paraglaciecola sp. L3A3]|uniref:gamma-glutamyl-gamma-aminobutyrate hydrolase family protein n=1 Tax=Paraglaciecola sp. L3A3 TaxID=2686358 RepID=UPI00131DD662|nr:gamma-glutamyl-gamma-aminobutyrate hydrolase family protein [Paraglaciecola sp. L3A3]
MTLIGITMRADCPADYDEIRDGLDQQWLPFLLLCGLTPILMPNNPSLIKTYLEQFVFSGIILTGGNSPVQCGGNSAARDQVDAILIDWAIQYDKPLIGVCRGMQSIQLAYQQSLGPVSGHVRKHQVINIDGQQRSVNSYHNLGAKSCQLPLEPWAMSEDGVIKAVKHIHKNIYGIMWHPERNQPFQQRDIDFFKQVFSS